MRTIVLQVAALALAACSESPSNNQLATDAGQATDQQQEDLRATDQEAENLGKAAAEPPPATSASSSTPSYSTTAYCQKIGDTAGGSAVIEKTCREQEAEARSAISSMSISSRTMNYCDRIGQTVGGSYVIFKTCVEQENEAAESL